MTNCYSLSLWQLNEMHVPSKVQDWLPEDKYKKYFKYFKALCEWIIAHIGYVHTAGLKHNSDLLL